MTNSHDCHFCKIANNYTPSQIIYESDELIVFPSFEPIRESHTLIVTKNHYDYFDDLPTIISHKIIDLAQKIAKAQKILYPVERVGFLYTGGDIAHVHAHVVPLFEKTDITSLQYVKNKSVEFKGTKKVTPEDMQSFDLVTRKLKSALENAI